MATSNADIALEALRAIRARIDGEYDNPFLVAVGTLSVSTAEDVMYIATRALNRIDGVDATIRQLERPCVGTYCHEEER